MRFSSFHEMQNMSTVNLLERCSETPWVACQLCQQEGVESRVSGKVFAFKFLQHTNQKVIGWTPPPPASQSNVTRCHQPRLAGIEGHQLLRSGRHVLFWRNSFLDAKTDKRRSFKFFYGLLLILFFCLTCRGLLEARSCGRGTRWQTCGGTWTRPSPARATKSFPFCIAPGRPCGRFFWGFICEMQQKKAPQ